jgi:hypothetical protein
VVFFLALAYFGTDHPGTLFIWKIGSRKPNGIIMNGLLKVPMQFFILLTVYGIFATKTQKDTDKFLSR